MKGDVLQAEREYLAGLLEAIQRCVYFLDASVGKIHWPLTSDYLESNKKNVALFESLSSVNERFAKLQDTLGAAMRHATVLSGEPSSPFLKVLAFYEKAGVIRSIDIWQLCRTTRNLAAHDYETDYAEIAEHFNSLHELLPSLYGDAAQFLKYSKDSLSVVPRQNDFSDGFAHATKGL